MANLNRSRKRRYVRHFLRQQCAKTGETYNRQMLDRAIAPKPKAAPKADSTVGGFFK